MIAESTDIKFACSQCGQRIVVDKSAAGLNGTCPICEGPVTVPAESIEQDEPERTETVASGHAHSAFAGPGLDETRDELFSSSVTLGQVQQELDEARRELERQRGLFKRAVDECERITASATHAQAEIKSFQADRQQLKADLSQTKQRALAAENQMAELAVSLAAAHEENAALQQQIDLELNLSRERLAATETQLEVRERALAAVEEENSEIVQSLAGAQAELASLNIELSSLRQDMGAAQQLLQEAASTEEYLQQARQDLEARLEKATREGVRLLQERDQVREESEVLRRDLISTDAGQELIDLRGELRDLKQDRSKIADTLAEKRTELRVLSATEQDLRGQLAEVGRLRDESERQATANSELQLNKDNEVLRGIVARQNTTLGVYYSEVRRLRRARFALRIVYGLFGFALLGLIAFAAVIFMHDDVGELLKQYFH